jgi:MoaA/NifB/PqqE/SkfB family radical SAM enzyme
MKLLPVRSLVRDTRFTAGIVLRRPFSLLVQVTNRCNMRCSFCDFWPNAAAKKDELTASDYERVAEELAGLGCFAVSIEGGEPFVRPDLVEIVRAFSKKHVTMLFTNGWYVTPENARELWNAGLAHASVSIDYSDAARHDEKRGIVGTTERAWRAVDVFRETAPRGGKQVNVMSVLMEDNHEDFPALVAKSAAARVGHQVTLISVSGYRRGKGPDRLPPPEAAETLGRLFRDNPHMRFFESYFDTMKLFLEAGGKDAMPTCTAGEQSMNLDHVGNVAPCIERLGDPVGNVKTESVPSLLEKLERTRGAVSKCQDCWTACRGFQQALAGGASRAAFHDLATRMRSF